MTGIKSIYEGLQKMISVNDEDAKIIAGTESIDPSLKHVVDGKVSELESAVESAFSDLEVTSGIESIDIKPYQVEAAKAVAARALNPVAILNKVATRGYDQVDAGTNAITIDSRSYVDDYIPEDQIKAGIESFDGQDVSASLYSSVIFNSLVIRQDPVNELFYPIIVGDGNKAGITVTARVTSIMNTVRRDISGRPVEFKTESIIKKLNDTELFTTDANRLHPVYRPESASQLLDVSGAKRDITIFDDIKITTAPIKTGVEVDLLGISQTDELIAKGIMDETDSLNARITIESLYFSLKGNDTDGNEVTEYFKKDIVGLPAIFTYTPTGHSKDLQLDYKTDSIAFVGGNITTVAGSVTSIADLANLTAGYTVKVRINLKGDANAQHGTYAVYPVKVELAGVTDAAGNELPETDATYIKMKAIFDNAKVEATDPEYYASNSNARFRGKLLTTNAYTNVYTVPIRTKVREITPVINTGSDGDVAGLIGQIEFNKQALNKTGLLELNRVAATLENVSDDTKAFGIVNELVNKTFIRRSLDLVTIVDSVESVKREEDIRAALQLYIKNIALELYTNSNYNKAFEALYPGVKPTVIIGVDTNVGRFVSSFEDEVFVYKVGVSNDTLVNGKMFISFGIMGQSRNKEASLLNFGACFWMPEVVISLQRQENGTVKQETISMPRYLHQMLMPILGVVEVSGVDDVTGKVAQNIKSV